MRQYLLAGLLAVLFVPTAASANRGIWISDAEIAALPMSGKAWDSLKKTADSSTGAPNIADQDDQVDVRVLAKALVYARTHNAKYRTDVINACMAAIDTELGGRTLALGRALVSYVIAADLVGLPSAYDAEFKDWLERAREEDLDSKTLISTHEKRPNNWGTHAGASRIAVALYLGDYGDLERAARVFKGWLGDRSTYSNFKYGDLSWQANSSKPVGINPIGAMKQGHSIDGVLPDDERRAGDFEWPPPKENYVYEALQGALTQAVLLHRAGYDVWNWENQALLRAFEWLHEQAGFPADGDDSWEPYIVNHFYRTKFPAPLPSKPGKGMGWTDWTLGS